MKIKNTFFTFCRQISRIILKRDLIITFFATFLGAYLAFRAAQFQADIQAQNGCIAHLRLVSSELSAIHSRSQLITEKLTINLNQDSSYTLLPFQARLSNKAINMATQSEWVSRYASFQLLNDILALSISIDTFNRELDILNSYMYSVHSSEKKFDARYFIDLTQQLRNGATELETDIITLAKKVRIEVNDLETYR